MMPIIPRICFENVFWKVGVQRAQRGNETPSFHPRAPQDFLPSALLASIGEVRAEKGEVRENRRGEKLFL